MDSVQTLLKKHDDLEKSAIAQEETVKVAVELADKHIEGGHYAKDEIKERRDVVSL